MFIFTKLIYCVFVTQGTGSGGDNIIMDNNVVHTMANGGDARGGTREEIRQVP